VEFLQEKKPGAEEEKGEDDEDSLGRIKVYVFIMREGTGDD